MDIRFQAGGASKWKADAVISFVFEGEDAEQACSALIQNALWLGIAPAWRDFRGKNGERLTRRWAYQYRAIFSTKAAINALSRIDYGM